MTDFLNRFRLLSFSFALAVLVGGCSHGSSNNAAPSPQAVKAAAQAQASDRELIEQIPPPAKTRYMSIHSKADWENPFLVVSEKTVSLRVMNPPAPHSDVLPGNLLQPANARKSLLELRLADLPDALASIPENSWPYGRVVAVEEDPAEVRADRIQVRRNVEATIQMLNNLGVVVYEWSGTK
jgi:hypothetical protein